MKEDLAHEVRRARSQLAVAYRMSRGGGKGAPDRLARAKGNLAFAKLRRAISEELSASQPTEEQIAFLVGMLQRGGASR
jgi:hypothetical protein